MPEAPLTLLDACAVVSLYATRRMADIVRVVSGNVAVVDVVASESQFVFRGGSGEDAREREPIDLSRFIEDGALSVLSTEVEEELLTFIDLTQVFSRHGRGGQGEAMTASVAIHRQCIVVTDDRKATRLLTEKGVALRTSLDLIKSWSEQEELELKTLREVLVDLRQRGTYEPHRSHPLRGWWERGLGLR